MGGRLLDYAAQGLAAARPTAASMPAKIAAGGASFYYATDTGALNIFDAAAVAWVTMGATTATKTIYGRKTAGTGLLEALTLSDILDFVGAASQGDILFRGATTWANLGAGTSGYFLKTQGPGANPVWAAASGGGTNPSVVQYASSIGASGACTLGAAPTPGNLLVAVGTHYANVVVNSDWTPIVDFPGAVTDGTIIATKVATADDAATVTPYGACNSAGVTVFEVTDWNGAVIQPFNYKQEVVTGALTCNFGSPKAGSLLVGHATTVSANVAPTSITGAGTVGTTVTGATTSASPRQITPFYTAAVAKGAKAIIANYAGTPRQYVAGVMICAA